MGRKRDTREEILGTARRLFNERGSTNVTTNHIAAAAGISPGNLYYHFRNKEEIVRELVERYVRYYDGFYPEMEALADHPGRIPAVLHAALLNAWEYRFYLREMLPLFQRDPELARRYREVQRQRTDPFATVVGAMRRAGVLRLPEDASLERDLGRLIWLLNHFWIPFIDLERDDAGPEHLGEGVRLTVRILEPYLAEGVVPHLREGIAALPRAGE